MNGSHESYETWHYDARNPWVGKQLPGLLCYGGAAPAAWQGPTGWNF